MMLGFIDRKTDIYEPLMGLAQHLLKLLYELLSHAIERQFLRSPKPATNVWLRQADADHVAIMTRHLNAWMS
jgi:hypothetical protein